jgi:serine/threonine protein kinase
VVLRGGERVVWKDLAPARDGTGRQQRLLHALREVRHPALACVLEVGIARGGRPRPWIATRWVEGTCAREAVAAGGIPLPGVLAVLRALAAGVASLHAAGVVHRDVAPGNVILPPAGGAVLIDFGHAVLAGEPLPESAGVVGTPGYVAPEEVLRGPAAVTTAVDVYGLGAVGYALLTGTAPASGEDVLAALAGAGRLPPRPAELGVELPAAFEAVLFEALAPDPSDRPSAATLAAALAGLDGAPGPRGSA